MAFFSTLLEPRAEKPVPSDCKVTSPGAKRLMLVSSIAFVATGVSQT